MEINESIKDELLTAIRHRVADSFETKVFNRLEHFVSSEGKVRGLYVCTIKCDGIDFKVYMI